MISKFTSSDQQMSYFCRFFDQWFSHLYCQRTNKLLTSCLIQFQPIGPFFISHPQPCLEKPIISLSVKHYNAGSRTASETSSPLFQNFTPGDRKILLNQEVIVAKWSEIPKMSSNSVFEMKLKMDKLLRLWFQLAQFAISSSASKNWLFIYCSEVLIPFKCEQFLSAY